MNENKLYLQEFIIHVVRQDIYHGTVKVSGLSEDDALSKYYADECIREAVEWEFDDADNIDIWADAV